MNKTEYKAARLRMQEVATRLGEINEWVTTTQKSVNTEKRSMTKEENNKFSDLSAEKDALLREKDILRLSVEAYKAGYVPSEREVSAKRAFAEIVTALKQKRSIPEAYAGIMEGNELKVPAYRSDTFVATADIAPVVPLTIGEIINPLNNGIIYNKVGLKMQYGLKGDFVYPVLAACECSFMGENVELTDSKISMSKLTPTPQRVGITIPVSNTAIDEANVSLQDVVIGQIQQALINLINKWMFSSVKLTNDSTGGCLLTAMATPAVKTAGDITWAKVLALESAVMKKHVIIDGTACFVCNSSLLATLKATPKTTYAGQFIAEGNAANCTIDGFPVFITEDIADGYLAFGVFQYDLLGQFGQARLIVDPYTLATKNMTRFTFNTRYAQLVLRDEAFAVLEVTSAA